MIFRRKIRSLLLGLMFRPGVIRMNRWLAEKHRQLTGRKHVVSVFLQLDDPYSYILSHYLPSFAASYDIELRLYLSEALGDEYQPAPEMLPNTLSPTVPVLHLNSAYLFSTKAAFRRPSIA